MLDEQVISQPEQNGLVINVFDTEEIQPKNPQPEAAAFIPLINNQKQEEIRDPPPEAKIPSFIVQPSVQERNEQKQKFLENYNKGLNERLQTDVKSQPIQVPQKKPEPKVELK